MVEARAADALEFGTSERPYVERGSTSSRVRLRVRAGGGSVTVALETTTATLIWTVLLGRYVDDSATLMQGDLVESLGMNPLLKI